MKRVSLIIPTLFSLLLFLSTSPLMAQQESNTTEKKKIVIIKKQVDEDGTVTVEKIVKEGEEADQLIQEIHVDQDGSDAEIDIEIINDGESRDVKIFKFNNDDNSSMQDLNIEFTDEDGNKIIKMLRGSDEAPEVIEWKGQGEIPAEVQERLDELGIDVKKHHGMHWINAHGNHSNADKAFLGVVIREIVDNKDGVETKEGFSDQGVVVNEVVDGSAAAEAGLKDGDIISSIDGQAIRSFSDLTNLLSSKKPNDKVAIDYLRDGQANQVEATLKQKANDSHGFNWDQDYNFNFDYDYDYDYRSGNNERPCVFIGVYVNSSRSQSNGGAKVTGIIEDTPASVAQLQRGDLIIAINNAPISNYKELLTERNKYNPGDKVNLSISRGGETQQVEIQFKDCGEKESPGKIAEEEEVIENIQTTPTVPAGSSAKLELENFRAFPNPTAGEVTVRFSGEAVPTIVSVVDISGRALFNETLNNFDGDYNNRIDLSQAPVGTLLLTIRQGDQVFTQTLVRSESTGL